ncbi:HAD-IIA family hydrolase [Nocardioides sp.]|uniref:HAD-IIA family hydrolase n=1 Tax=Nocardioides sp. TaxID=35761 RepID=UPI003784272A
MLGSSTQLLCEAHDLAMLDLDGVVYVGGEAVPGAPEHLAAARAAGMRLAFVTNNASRPPTEVASHLQRLGVAAAAEDVVTSAQAAAHLVADRWGAGARVVCLGAAGLREALEGQGLRPVTAADEAVAVVTGYGPDVVWSEIMRAAVRIRDGLPWVASNTDATFPAPYGVAPGHGVQVDMLRRFAGVEPVVAGKPERPLLDETVRRVGGRRPLMVGDRLDTDIEGAHRAGVPSLLVLTGVTGLADLVTARDEQRPTYLSPDLAGLLSAHAAPAHEEDGGFLLGGWTARVVDSRLAVDGDGDGADWWRVAAVAAWAHLDATGEPADVTGVAGPRDSLDP